MSIAPAAALSAAASVRPRARMSLRMLVPAASAMLLAGAMLAGTVVAERHARNLLVAEARARLALEAELLARASASAMLEGFPELTLQPILRDLLRGRDDLSMAMVIDREGRILAHPDTRKIGRYESVPRGVGQRVGAAWLREQGASLIAVMPIRHASGPELGSAIVVMPRAPFERQLAAARQRQWWIALLLVAASAVVTFVLMSRLLRPVTRLREGLERIGRGDLSTRLALRDRTELGLLADTLDAMTARLQTAQRGQLERERLSAEMEAASRIQASLRPGAAIRKGAYVVAGHQRPAAEVGGDYFDAMELPDGRLGLVIADVSGKGLAGCLVAFMLAALVRVTREHEPSPSRLLIEVDRYLRPILERGAFVTVWYGVLDPLSGDVTFASAGHLPTLIRRANGQIESHESKGIPLGLLTPAALAKGLRDVRTRLAPGDVLLQITDGFSEAEHPHGRAQLGLDGVSRALAESGGGAVDHVIERLCSDVEAWTNGAIPDDDQTVIALRRDPAPVSRGPAETFDATTWLKRARAGGGALNLAADLADLERIPAWLQSTLGRHGLSSCAYHGLESALYEICANVMEHGYGLDGQGRMEVWWVPDGIRSVSPNRTAPGLCGWFVLLERGRAFDPSNTSIVDLSHRDARLKGRGLGIAMVRQLLSGLHYQPATPEGNVTWLEVDTRHIEGVLKGDADERCA